MKYYQESRKSSWIVSPSNNIKIMYLLKNHLQIPNSALLKANHTRENMGFRINSHGGDLLSLLLITYLIPLSHFHFFLSEFFSIWCGLRGLHFVFASMTIRLWNLTYQWLYLLPSKPHLQWKKRKTEG